MSAPADALEPPSELSLFDATGYKTAFNLRDRYGVPPLSVIDSAAQQWQQRKQEWCAAYPAIVDEAATPDNVFGAFVREANGDIQVGRSRSSFGHTWTEPANFLADQMARMGGNATTFDPVLAELCYQWWSAPGSLVYDPFAGGPVRGVVADVLGRQYLGLDVRQEQVDANYAAWPDGGAAWVQADSSTWQQAAGSADFVLSCPPYGGLERYSDQPDDLSTLRWPEFRIAYRAAIHTAVRALRQDRFACFVVANFKEPEPGQKRRALRNLVGLTCDAFEEAGAPLYTDVVHMTPVGTTAVRTAFHFPRTLRPQPRHQMVLVFLKGDSHRAVAYCTGEQP